MNDKEKLLRDHSRMCMDLDCGSCPIGEECGLHCNKWMMEHTSAAVEIIEKWAAEHPVKTRQDLFLEQFPNAEMMGGALMIMPCSIDIRLVQTDCCNNSSNCSRCRKEYWLQEVENE